MTMQRTRYSLASLLLLIAVASVFLAAVRMAVVGEHFATSWMWPVALGLGVVIGVIVGVGIGVHQRAEVLGTIVGAIAGAAAGAMAGVLLVVPESLLAALVGSAVIIVFAQVVRRLSGRAPASAPEQHVDRRDQDHA